MPGISLLVPRLASAAPAAPAPSGNWIDQNTISYNGQTFSDNAFDPDWEFGINGDTSSSKCGPVIHNFSGGKEDHPEGGTLEDGRTGAGYLTRSKSPADQSCNPDIKSTSSDAAIKLNNPGYAQDDFLWQDATTIVSVKGDVFIQNPTDKLFYEQGGDECKDSLAITNNGATAQLIVRTNGSNTSYDSTNLWIHDALFNAGTTSTANCATVYNAIPVGLSNATNGMTQPAGSSAAGSAAATAANGDSNDTLECGSTALNWIICPVVQLADTAAQRLDNFIMNTLDVDVGPIFDQTTKAGSASQGYYKAWNSFRVLAIAILLIGGLIMVASQALGFEFLDAYTIRKVLPRLLIAVIGISLSWPLMRLAVNFFDTLGFDLRNLMYSPFSTFKGTLSVGTSILTTLAVPALLLAFGPAALTFLLTALLAVFVGFVILVLRQVAIIMLIILAPVAIACYILPNTQKIWKLWYDNFLGLMLMFPIISGLIAAGHIFAAVALTSDSGYSGGAAVGQALAMIAYFLPYFLLPLAARLATGIIGNLAGIVNDRHKGAFDRLKGARSNARQRIHQERMEGKRGVVGNRGGGLYRRVATGEHGLTARNRAATEARRLAERGAVAKQPGAAELLQDDKVRAALLAGSEQEARANLAAMGVTSSAEQNDVINRARAVGFTHASRLAAWQMETTSGKGRVLDKLAAANGTDANAQMRVMNQQIAGAAGVDSDSLLEESMYNFGSNGRGDLRQKTASAVLDNKVDGQIWATATGGAIDSLAGEAVTRLSDPTTSVPRKRQAAAQLLSMHESLSRMSEPARQAAVAHLQAAGVNMESSEPVEVQLAKQTTGMGAAYDATKAALDSARGATQGAQQAVDAAVARDGAGSASAVAAVAALASARAAEVTARTAHAPNERIVMDAARETRATSSTYGSGVPFAERQ
ncbi:MAG: hypothetical protein WDN27_01745 [Candidatus Saccharibacteria bacterium]